MSEIIERVARALAWDELTPKGRDTCNWMRDFAEVERQKYRGKARAAIQAMRFQPTTEMITAFESNEGLFCGIGWEAFIDAALTPNKKPASD